MNQKTAMITGATGGIGQAVTKAYDRLGYSLILVGRNADKLNTLNRELRGQHEIVTANVALVAENRRIAAEANATHGRIDLLLNLAGVLSKERQTTREGHELTLATNVLGPIALTQELGAARSVVTGSGAINFVKDLTPDDLQSEHRYDGFRRAYARSKAYLTLWAFTTGKKWDVSVADPGGTKTDMTLDKAVPLPIRLLRPLIMHGPEKAALAFTKAGHEMSIGDAAGKIILPTSNKRAPQRFLDQQAGETLARHLADLMTENHQRAGG